MSDWEQKSHGYTAVCVCVCVCVRERERERERERKRARERVCVCTLWKQRPKTYRNQKDLEWPPLVV